MKSIDEAIERLKTLVCPTDDFMYRIKAILLDKGINDYKEIKVDKVEEFIDNGRETYIAKVKINDSNTLVIKADSGLDDYVLNVTDVKLDRDNPI